MSRHKSWSYYVIQKLYAALSSGDMREMVFVVCVLNFVVKLESLFALEIFN